MTFDSNLCPSTFNLHQMSFYSYFCDFNIPPYNYPNPFSRSETKFLSPFLADFFWALANAFPAFLAPLLTAFPKLINFLCLSLNSFPFNSLFSCFPLLTLTSALIFFLSFAMFLFNSFKLTIFVPPYNYFNIFDDFFKAFSNFFFR